MHHKPDWIERRQLLRTRAEGLLSGVSVAGETARPAELLMHELLVHKVELEMQVEELRRAHIEMEEARDRYLDLYEFAPVGYLTINRSGLISEINLTGAALLGSERSKLIDRRFAKFISATDIDRWHRLFMSIMDSNRTEMNAFDIALNRADASTFMVRVDCQRRGSIDAPPTLRVALTDTSRLTAPVAPEI